MRMRTFARAIADCWSLAAARSESWITNSGARTARRTHEAPRDGAEVPKWAERAEPAHAVQREALVAIVAAVAARSATSHMMAARESIDVNACHELDMRRRAEGFGQSSRRV